MDGHGPLATLPVTCFFFFLLCFLFNFYLQTASALLCAAVPRSFRESIIQAPLWSRLSSTQSSLATDNSTSDVKTGQGYMALPC
jgi:hypothetical protein